MLLPSNPFELSTADSALKERIPSRTWRIDFASNRIYGFIDDSESVLQAIHLIFVNERYAYEIFTSNYGIELENLFGREMDFVLAVIENRIRDAILADDRVLGLNRFEAEVTDRESIEVYCLITTIFGLLEIREEVAFNGNR